MYFVDWRVRIFADTNLRRVTHTNHTKSTRIKTKRTNNKQPIQLNMATTVAANERVIILGAAGRDFHDFQVRL